MPLLKYQCERCGNVFEELVFGTPKPVCPQCGSTQAKRHYQGKCYFGATASSGKGTGGCSCGGSCTACSSGCGCGH